MRRVLEQSFYELLEISPSATPEEIERAWERARRLYGPGSLAAHALLPPAVAEALAGRIDEAYEVLLDAEARAAYDARLPAEEARPPRGLPEAPGPQPPPPAAPPPPAVEPPPRSFPRPGPPGPENSSGRPGRPAT